MLTNGYKLRGFSLIELMIAVAIMVIAFVAAAPNFSEWIQNSRIRKSADSIQNGLMLARSEAVHRNATTQFLTCGTAASWEILAASAAASTFVCGSTDETAGWERVQGTAPSENALVNNTQTTIGFNGMGRQISTTDLVSGGTTASPPVAVDINVGSTIAGAECFCPAGACGYPVGIPHSTTGTLRCLRISVSPGGQIRMCNPTLSPSSPQGC